MDIPSYFFANRVVVKRNVYLLEAYTKNAYNQARMGTLR